MNKVIGVVEDIQQKLSWCSLETHVFIQLADGIDAWEGGE